MKKNILLNQSIYRFMRNGLLPIILINCMTAMAYAKPSSGQEVLNKRINVIAEQKEVRTVLSEIARMAEIKFVYSSQRIPSHQKVSLNAHDKKLSEVLDLLFQPLDIFYRLTGNKIVLMRKGDDTNSPLSIKEDEDKSITGEQSAAIEITGKVTNENGEPLAGVSVLIKGSSKGTTTATNGSFTISVNPGETLEFSIIGYKVHTIKVGQENMTVNIQLQADVSKLNEIVVVGYGTQKRSTLTGAVASVSSKTLNELPVASVDQALQGRVAGLQVTNNGSPGTSPIVTIRGISTINFATDPLYVIDGFPTSNLSNFDSKDIESLEVLKDASAAAIYGSRATNGVVIITTKKGRKDNRVQVALDSYVGIQSPSKKIDLMNTNQYVQYATALLGNAGKSLPPRLQSANFNQPIYSGATQTYAQTNTDWQDAYFVKNALITGHNLSLSGGNAVSRFYSSAGYFKQDGITQGLNYERGNFRINSEHNISKAITFGENLLISYGNQHYEGTGGNRSPLTNVIRMPPYIPLHDPTTIGGYRGPDNSIDASDPTNPVEAAKLNNFSLSTLKTLGTSYIEISLMPWLKFRSTFGVDYTNVHNQRDTAIIDDHGTIVTPVATIRNIRQEYTTLLFTQQLTFDRSFGAHHFTLTAVHERQGQHYFNDDEVGNQDNNNVRSLTGATNISAVTRFEDNLILSYIGRLTYDYAGKYLLSGSIRRDGMSVWAPGHKFKNFPSASVGWKIDQEPFMNGIKDISELKLRAGYGLTGLNALLGAVGDNGGSLGNYPWEVLAQANQALYPFGSTLTSGPASFYNQLDNPSLGWETTKQLNIGLDLGLFNNRLTLTAEYFKRKTDNLILAVPTPFSFGFAGLGPNTNVASMQNTGVELQAGYHQRTGEFKWDLTGLVSVIRNKVLSLNTPTASIKDGANDDFGSTDAITNTVAGRPVQSFYGYVTDGIFQSAAEVAKGPIQKQGTDPTISTAPGDIRFKDLNGDGRITDSDRTFLGSYLPSFTYSLNYSASYKNLDLTIFLQGVQGNKVFNAERVISEGMARLFNASPVVLDAWTSTHTNTSIPRAISGDPNSNLRVSNRWVEDGSYLRLKNLMIGYTIPAATLLNLTKGAISRFRVYVSSQNLLTLTHYKGWDPEIGSRKTSLTNGVDYGQYPSARSFQLGLQVGF